MACCASDRYLIWLSHYSDAFHGSTGIANYFANAALAFEEQAHPKVGFEFDVFDARDNLADILMASAPLSSNELRAAATPAIREANADFHVPSLLHHKTHNGFLVALTLDRRNGYGRE